MPPFNSIKDYQGIRRLPRWPIKDNLSIPSRIINVINHILFGSVSGSLSIPSRIISISETAQELVEEILSIPSRIIKSLRRLKKLKSLKTFNSIKDYQSRERYACQWALPLSIPSRIIWQRRRRRSKRKTLSIPSRIIDRVCI